MKSFVQKISVLLALTGLIFSCVEQPVSELEKSYPESFALTAKNTTPLARADQLIVMDAAEIASAYPDFNAGAFVVFSAGSELPSQAIDPDGDGQPDQVVFLADFTAQEAKSIVVRYAKTGTLARDYPKRTQAEISRKTGGKFENRKYIGGEFENVRYLRVPPEHTDHSLFIRYEGPGWESDKVGYRFYMDWRNATDIFGKKTSAMVLQNVGQDGFDSYHEMSDWGMDILKVGESLGIGSIGMWSDGKVNRVSVTDSITCAILADGPLYSHIRTRYFGWNVGGKKYKLTSDLSISAGSRLTRHETAISGSPENLCTGIVKHPETNLLEYAGAENGWSYLATYGKQSLADDNLGMAVLFRTADLIEKQEDPNSHVVVLKPANGKLTYYFLAAWEKEPGGIQSEVQFVRHLEQVIAGLDTPITVELSK